MVPPPPTTPPRHRQRALLPDFGWADAGWHRPAGYTDVQTPAMDGLVAEGVMLERHYVYSCCAPTRAAIQSGRNPIHVNTVNSAPTVRNPADNISGWAGMPLRMTGIAEVMRRQGYRTSFSGKWDCGARCAPAPVGRRQPPRPGMATPQHTPRGRGYTADSLLYFHHTNDAWVRPRRRAPSKPTGSLD